MPQEDLPFDSLMFAVSKPSWGTSSLVVARTSSALYELRLKRIRNGAATDDDAREYSPDAARSLFRWICALGFCEQGAPTAVVEHAGSWSLKIVRCDGTSVEQGGTDYPDSFPDLLSTMSGLGLPGFSGVDVQAFLSDFRTPQAHSQPGLASSDALPAGLDALGLDGADLGGLLSQLAKDPERAEAALRSQLGHVPASTKRQILEFVRVNDPGHYEWWRRLLG